MTKKNEIALFEDKDIKLELRRRYSCISWTKMAFCLPMGRNL